MLIRYHSLPRGLSRLVARLSGRQPDPDMVVEVDGARVIVEAKYRRLNRRRLRLADALRVAGYLLDVSDRKRLRAVIAHLHGRRETVVARTPAGTVEVVMLPVNPRTGDDEIRSAVTG